MGHSWDFKNVTVRLLLSRADKCENTAHDLLFTSVKTDTSPIAFAGRPSSLRLHHTNDRTVIPSHGFHTRLSTVSSDSFNVMAYVIMMSALEARRRCSTIRDLAQTAARESRSAGAIQ